ncbi:hypothetical protein, partial [Clostridioides difficile]|uniref:hypothetical protein n=1 Tax=Clostridioides difficile TaxID=1496 RepID=UPI001A9A8AB9
ISSSGEKSSISISFPVSSNTTRTSQSPCKKNFLTGSSLTSLTCIAFLDFKIAFFLFFVK